MAATAALKQQCDFDSRTRRRPVSRLWRTELDELFFFSRRSSRISNPCHFFSADSCYLDFYVQRAVLS